MGVEPELLARQIAEGGQIGAAVAEVLRGKAMALLASRVKIQDEAGHELDYGTLLGQDADDATVDGDTSAEDAAAGDSAGEGDAAPVATAAEVPAGGGAGGGRAGRGAQRRSGGRHDTGRRGSRQGHGRRRHRSWRRGRQGLVRPVRDDEGRAEPRADRDSARGRRE